MIQIYFSLVRFMVLSVSGYIALNGMVSGEWWFGNRGKEW